MTGNFGKHEAEARLLEASILWSQNKDEEAVNRIQHALQIGLPPADEAYARGLLARTFEEAAVHYREALRLDPVHYYAMSKLCSCLMLQGKSPEARDWAAVGQRIFPEDSSFSDLVGFPCRRRRRPGNRRASPRRIASWGDRAPSKI